MMAVPILSALILYCSARTKGIAPQGPAAVTIQRPDTIEDLVVIFRKIWKTCFFNDMYIREPMVIEGNTDTWTGSQCNAYESLAQTKLTKGYECGCQAIRNGIMKALRLKPVHCIDKSLMKGDGQCVIRFNFEPK